MTYDAREMSVTLRQEWHEKEKLLKVFVVYPSGEKELLRSVPYEQRPWVVFTQDRKV